MSTLLSPPTNSTSATSSRPQVLECLPWDTIKSRAAESCPQPAVVLAKINVAARKCNAIQADGQVDLKPLLAFLVNQRHAAAIEDKRVAAAMVEADKPHARDIYAAAQDALKEINYRMDFMVREFAETAGMDVSHG